MTQDVKNDLDDKPVMDNKTPNDRSNRDKINSSDGDTGDKTQEQSVDNSRKPLIVALVTLTIIAVGLGAAIIYLGNSKVSNNNVELAEEEPMEYLDVTIPNNNLSDFDLTFMKIENREGNVVYSPLSIKYALAMLADGASGDSKEQITKIIGDYKPKAYINSTNRSLANVVFVNDAIADAVKNTYTDTIKTKYNADVVFDPFDNSNNVDKWVSDKTLGIINKAPIKISTDTYYILLNALAIDMNWNYQLQCTAGGDDVKKPVPCLDNSREGESYSVHYPHEKYGHYISQVGGKELNRVRFGDKDNINAAEIGASINRYDIINELGEDHIRDVVQKEYEAWLENLPENRDDYDLDFDIEKYISELAENYGQFKESTDFYYNISDDEVIFAKDLKEYDGSTLQYVGIMPKNVDLNDYIKTLTAKKVNSLIKDLKDVSSIDNYKEGVVTKVKAYIPLFEFDYEISDLRKSLNILGVYDVFSFEDANLSNMLEYDESDPVKPHIDEAVHKANINFSNDGIKAAAVTSLSGKGATGPGHFEYEWDVPIEEVDLTFDKPFLFIIRDKSSGEAWFIGTVYEPKELKE